MSTLQERYQYFHQLLQRTIKQQELLQKEKIALVEKHDADLVALEKKKQSTLKCNQEQLVKVEAFINIAKQHCDCQIDMIKSAPYDEAALSKLAVQLDKTKRNTKSAMLLFSVSSAQYKGLLAYQQTIDREISAERQKLSQVHEQNLEKITQQLLQQKTILSQQLHSSDMEKFLTFLENCFTHKFYSGPTHKPHIILGKVTQPFVQTAEDISITSSALQLKEGTIHMPLEFIGEAGAVLLCHYVQDREQEQLQGIFQLVLTLLERNSDVWKEFFFVDPLRYHSSALGILEPLSLGEQSVIHPVPENQEQVRNYLEKLAQTLREEQNNLETKNRVLIFHNFPMGYDAQSCQLIRQFILNSQRMGLMILLTSNNSLQYSHNKEIFQIISSAVTCEIYADEQGFCYQSQKQKFPFTWFPTATSLPSVLEKKYVLERPTVDHRTEYEARVGYQPNFQKGNRSLTNIPYGVDDMGNLCYLDLEQSNFATYLCGAARSGKSTLIHSLISGIIQNFHPDDVELWLIDFKMTEFSRYIDHLPPHVRYLMMDKSPEMVYDILDRLTEIMNKRQELFFQKWQKLQDVPLDKYMPSILVIIDEFSVMSQIIYDSVTVHDKNYTIVLQHLLTQGAALGFHFIFSSQGFYAESKGLTEMSINQIQQRIAMKSKTEEITYTLDLKSPSDQDRWHIGQLPVHKALVRQPIDIYGNQLHLVNVLYSSDYKKQEAFIHQAQNYFTQGKQFEPADKKLYIHKKPLILDGGKYHSFLEKQQEIQASLQEKQSTSLFPQEEMHLVLGQPRRMLPQFPVVIQEGYGENILMIAKNSEESPVVSVLLSMIHSLVLQGKQIELWAHPRNRVFLALNKNLDFQKISGSSVTIYQNLGSICQRISYYGDKFQKQEKEQRFILVLGYETLVMEMSYETQKSSQSAPETDYDFFTPPSTTTGEEENDELDLLQTLGISFDNFSSTSQPKKATNKPVEERANSTVEQSGVETSYDARDDLAQLLTLGSRLGYHFCFHLSTLGEIEQSRLDYTKCKHRIGFNMNLEEARYFFKGYQAEQVSIQESPHFRYSDGQTGLGFRPYFLEGLQWKNLHMKQGSVEKKIEEENPYLQ